MKKEAEFLENIKNLLQNRDFLVHTTPSMEGLMRPDFIIEKDNKKFIVEIKTGRRIKPKVFYQIISYLLRNPSYDGAYLIVPSWARISPFVQKKLDLNGIGLIKIIGNNLKFFSEPKEKSRILHNLISGKTNKILEKYKVPKIVKEQVTKDISQEVAKTIEKSLDKKEIKNFPKNIIIFVIIASLIGSSLWSIVQFLIVDLGGKLYQLLIPTSIFFILILVLVIYYSHIKNKSLDESENE